MILRRPHVLALVAVALLVWPSPRAGQRVSAAASTSDLRARDLWLAPDRAELAARQSLAEAVNDLASDRAASAGAGVHAVDERSGARRLCLAVSRARASGDRAARPTP
jgi:hypothetical protein